MPYGCVVNWRDRYVWQRNLGGYLDGAAGCFERVSVICTDATADKAYWQEGSPIYSYELSAGNVNIVPFSGAKSLSGLRSLFALLNRELASADFLYVFVPSFKSLLAAGMAARQRKPFAMYIGADWNDVARFILPARLPGVARLPAKALVARMERRAVARAAFALAHGGEIVDRYGGTKGRVFGTVPIMNWGVDGFHNREDTCGADRMRCLFVGSLVERKGIKYLLQGIAAALQAGVPMELAVVGKGTPEAEKGIRDAARELDIAERVNMHGYVSDPNDLLALYRAADVFVLPTLGEGFPRVVYEAMSQSLPVITTNTGSMPAVLRNGETALLIPPFSGQAVGEALEQLWKNGEIRRRLIAGGRELARTMFAGGSAAQFGELLERYVGHVEKA